LGQDEGWLLIFDQLENALELEERVTLPHLPKRVGVRLLLFTLKTKKWVARGSNPEQIG
jgi:hypothetical protein